MAGRLVNALGSSVLAAEAFSDLRHVAAHAALRGGARAGRRRSRADSQAHGADHRQGLRSRALRSRAARRGGAPHRHAHRAGGQGADRRGRQARRRGRGLRPLGRHQPGRHRHRDGAAARRGAAAGPEGARRHRRGLREPRPQASPHADARPHPAAAGDAPGARPEDRGLGLRHMPRRAPPRDELQGNAGRAVRRRLGQPVGAGREGRAGDDSRWPSASSSSCRRHPGSRSACASRPSHRTPPWWWARWPRPRATSR